MQNLARMFLKKTYRILQNASITAFTVSELLKENHPSPPRLGLNNGITVAILQSFGNYPLEQERFAKYNIGKDKTLVQFFSIDVNNLLGPDDWLFENI